MSLALSTVDYATRLFGQPIPSVGVILRTCRILDDQRYLAVVWAHTKELAGLGKNSSSLVELANLCCDASLPALPDEMKNLSVCGDLQLSNSDLIHLFVLCPGKT